MHAYYSERQAELGGVVEWAKESGEVIQVTEVCKKEKEEMVLKDMVHLGEVRKFVRRIDYGRMGQPGR